MAGIDAPAGEAFPSQLKDGPRQSAGHARRWLERGEIFEASAFDKVPEERVDENDELGSADEPLARH
jgi:hypothetical protein